MGGGGEPRGGIKQACEQLVRKRAAVVESQAQLEDSLRLLCAHLLPPPRSPGVLSGDGWREAGLSVSWW